MAYDPHLADSFREALPVELPFSEKRMMGGLCFLLNGNMVGGADRAKTGEGRFMFRVGKENEAIALARPGASVVELGGRRMGGMIFVDAAPCSLVDLRDWVFLALSFVETLPAK